MKVAWRGRRAGKGGNEGGGWVEHGAGQHYFVKTINKVGGEILTRCGAACTHLLSLLTHQHQSPARNFYLSRVFSLLISQHHLSHYCLTQAGLLLSSFFSFTNPYKCAKHKKYINTYSTGQFQIQKWGLTKNWNYF